MSTTFLIVAKEKACDDKVNRFSFLSRDSIFSSTTSASTSLGESFVSIASSTGSKSSCFDFLSRSEVSKDGEAIMNNSFRTGSMKTVKYTHSDPV